ncbi:MAG: TetR/AcrR family transcriptional regulator [Gemmatimonadaceae bacterium]|nr:TetR/AcrR family transcriptional regulator [Gemmatimonadaceae bacterium]
MATSSLPASPARPVRDRLLEAADRLFYAEGIRAVGIDRILAEAGAAKASLYAHFASKDELVAAYLANRAEFSRRVITRELDALGPDPRQRLFALFDFSMGQCDNPDFRGCPFQIAAAELPDANHPGSPVMLEHRVWMRNLIEGLVRQIAPAAPAELAHAINALHDGAASQVPTGTGREAMRGARWAAEQLLPQVRAT